MNIDNIALVRATNIIPFDGIIRPLSNSPYLKKNTNTDFSYLIRDILESEKLLPTIDYSKIGEEGYFENFAKQNTKFIENYLPYVSDYNSMVLFSLNGLCPDDNEHGFSNNTFSNKKCAIIEPLKYHINEVVSLVPTDTAIKGDVELSNEAVVFIEKGFYYNLPIDKKQLLKNMKVMLFEGELKYVIFEYLKTTNKYIPETLSLSRQHNGFIPSDTSESQIENIKNIAINYNIAQVLFFNIISGQNDEVDKLEIVKDEFEKANYVVDEYTIMFLEELLLELNANENIRNSVRIYLHDKNYLSLIGKLIKEYGMENYKSFVDKYNLKLKEMQKNNTLQTPEELVNNKVNKI